MGDEVRLDMGLARDAVLLPPLEGGLHGGMGRDLGQQVRDGAQPGHQQRVLVDDFDEPRRIPLGRD